MSSIDRFENEDRKVIYRGKRIVITETSGPVPVIAAWVLAKDPAGNEYFAFEASQSGSSDRGDSIVWRTFIDELKDK